LCKRGWGGIQLPHGGICWLVPSHISLDRGPREHPFFTRGSGVQSGAKGKFRVSDHFLAGEKRVDLDIGQEEIKGGTYRLCNRKTISYTYGNLIMFVPYWEERNMYPPQNHSFGLGRVQNQWSWAEGSATFR